MDLFQEKGASTWLTALSIDKHGFSLRKSAFSCDHPLTVEHSLSCPTGGFPSIRHNEVRDISALLLSEIYHGVSIEPHLQPLSGESLSHRSAIMDNVACLGIGVHGFWGGRFEKTFLDVRVFNPCA